MAYPGWGAGPPGLVQAGALVQLAQRNVVEVIINKIQGGLWISSEVLLTGGDAQRRKE